MKGNLSWIGFVGLLILIKSSAFAQKRPNVLFILSDDHSAPYLGCYGNSDLKTPNIDRLAKEGALFKKAYTTAPQCVQSRSSLMTGRNVLAVDMLRFSSALPAEHITFPEMMRKDGYFIGVCGRSYHLDGSGNFDPPETKEVFQELGLVTFPRRFDFVKGGGDTKVAELVEEFIDMVPKGKPFAMWVNYSNPHRVFTAKEFEPKPENLNMPYELPDIKSVREDLAAHYGEIQELDMYIGKLWEILEKRGLMDNTIIIFMGDNGSALLRGKGTLYRCGIHVPLLVRYPKKVRKGVVSDVLVSGIDIAPTILDLTAVKGIKEIEGRSFVSALNGDTAQLHDYVFAVRGPHAATLPLNSALFDLSRTVLNKDFKLIYNPLWQIPYMPVDFDTSPLWADLKQKAGSNALEPRFMKAPIFTPVRPMFELFDLHNDPYEFVNLAGNEAYKTIEHDLMKALHRWMIINRDVVPLPIPGGRKP